MEYAFEVTSRKTAEVLPVGLYENPEGDRKHDDAEFEEFMRSLKGHGVEQARIDAMRETRYGPKTAANQTKNQTVMEMDRPSREPMRPQRGEVRRPSTDQRKVRRQITVKAEAEGGTSYCHWCLAETGIEPGTGGKMCSQCFKTKDADYGGWFPEAPSTLEAEDCRVA